VLRDDLRSSLRTAWFAPALVVGGWACGGDAGAPTTPLAPLTPLQAAIVQRFQQEFGETIPRPAVFVPVLDPNRTCDWHVTSTAWLKPSAKTSTLLTLYTSGDGNLVRLRTSGTYLTPAGTFRVLVALVRHPQAIDDGGLALWEAAQRRMNSDHEAFTSSKGYAGPIVTFENTNVVIEPSQLQDPRSRAATVAALAALGHSDAGYDVVVSVSIDPATPEGGFAFPSSRFIYMGNFGFTQLPLSANAFASIARAVYGHEFAHLWGWPGTHDWAACHSAGLNPFGFDFWVPPILLGWEDVDGDRIPEILDPNPYGSSRP